MRQLTHDQWARREAILIRIRHLLALPIVNRRAAARRMLARRATL